MFSIPFIIIVHISSSRKFNLNLTFLEWNSKITINWNICSRKDMFLLFKYFNGSKEIQILRDINIL